MLHVAPEILQTLICSRKKTEDKIWLIFRAIEEENKDKLALSQWNYWEIDQKMNMIYEQRIFYKLYSWLVYVEWEGLVKPPEPIEEFDQVFGNKRAQKLICYLNTPEVEIQGLDKFYQLDNKAGIILLTWALNNLVVIK